MKAWAVLCGLVLTFSLHAAGTLPKGCVAVKVMGESLPLHALHSKLVFIHNITSSDVWLVSTTGWSGQLKPDRWSALVVSKEAFVLHCIESTPGHEQSVPCEGAIAACHWKFATIPKENHGTGWAGENQPLGELTAAIGGRGYVLPAKV